MKAASTLLIIIFCSFSIVASAQPTIATDSVIQTGTCAGSSVIVRYHTSGSFSFGNVFTAQLSNAFGQFTTPVNIGTSYFNLGFILATLPNNVQFGFLYRIRVVSSNPAVIGTPSLNTVLVTSTPFTATILATPGKTMCPGDTVTLTAGLPNATYLWSTGATTQAIKVTQVGSYWAKVTDPLGCVARDTVIVTLKPNCTTGLSDPLVNGTFSVSPNPVSSKGVLFLNNISAEYKQLQLVDATGGIAAIITLGTSPRVELGRYHLGAGAYQLLLLSSKEVRKGVRVIILP